MYDYLACRTCILVLQMFHQAPFAKRVQALGDRSRVYQVSPAYYARYQTI